MENSSRAKLHSGLAGKSARQIRGPRDRRLRLSADGVLLVGQTPAQRDSAPGGCGRRAEVTHCLVRPPSGDKVSNDGIWKEVAVDDLDKPQPRENAGGLHSVGEQRIFKRSRLERYIDILKVVDEFGPIRRTHILYKANLSWGDLEDSLGRLEQAGALQRSVSKTGVHYGITDSGKKFLANIVTVRELLALGQEARGHDPHRPRG